MCGIAGVFDRTASRTNEDLGAMVGAMAETVRHRGPDGHGVWVDAAVGIGFGHRRLSILDLTEAGAQPMVSRDGRWVLTFNGEIYNHADLARDLSGIGVRFRGHSDTEIFIEAIAHWGVRATLERVDGMFAFAVWDRNERRLTLVRDRIGEKPLYYGTAGGEFVFGSGLDPVRVHPKFDTEIDRDALCGLLRYKYVPAPLSIYRDAKKLEPAHLLEVTAEGVGDPEEYWSYAETVERGEREPFRGTLDEAVDELDGLLRSSIGRRLVADVPVGAFLSGGIDSSTVVALMQQVSSGPVKTFAIGSPDAGFDESTDARRVAEHLGTKHHELIVTGDDALAVVDRLPQIYDEPFADSSQIPTFLVAQMARPEVTVALTGDGGDELFGGYNRYRWIPSIHGRLRHLPVPVRARLAKAAMSVPPARWDRFGSAMPRRIRPRQLGLKVEKVCQVAGLDDPATMYLRLVSHWDDPESLLRGGRDPNVLASMSARWPCLNDSTAALMAVDTLTYLPGDILTKVDRATMAVGLEGRLPLLDRRVIEFAATLPMEMKASGERSKLVLRHVVDRYLPAHFLDRTKAGFGVPLDAWLRGPLKEWGADLLRSPLVADYFDSAVLMNVWGEHQSGARNHGYRLWDALCLSAWMSADRASP